MDTYLKQKEHPQKRVSNRERGAVHQNLFFEMSRVVESPELLKGWVRWFRQLHIPCLIAKTEGGYSLWRKGEEAGRKKSQVATVLLQENIVSSFGLTTTELALLRHTPTAIDGVAGSAHRET